MYGDPVQVSPAAAGDDVYGESSATSVHPSAASEVVYSEANAPPSEVGDDAGPLRPRAITGIYGAPLTVEEAAEYAQRTAASQSDAATNSDGAYYGQPLATAGPGETYATPFAGRGRLPAQPPRTGAAPAAVPAAGEDLYGFSTPKSVPPPPGHVSQGSQSFADETYDALPPSNRTSMASGGDGGDAADDIYGFCEPRKTAVWQAATQGTGWSAPAAERTRENRSVTLRGKW